MIWLLNRGRTLWILGFPSYLGFLFSLWLSVGALELDGCFDWSLECSIYSELNSICSIDVQSVGLRHHSKIGALQLASASIDYSEDAT